MFTKEWLEARIKEVSTKWGLGILLLIGAANFSSDQIGKWTQNLTALAGLAAAAKLISVKEGEGGAS